MSVFLFPGQGSQAPGMGHDYYCTSAAARAVFDEAAEAAGPSFLDTIFHGSAEALADTRNAQPALLTTEVAIARHLMAEGLAPEVCAGHSLGEFAALVVAGVLEFGVAFRLTQVRARLMAEGVPEGGMAAVVGLEADAVAAALPDTVDVANYNGPGQTIISASKDALRTAIEALEAAGAKRVLPLAVSGPFHSRHMRAASAAFAKELQGIAFSRPRCRFVSSVSGQYEDAPERMRALLGEQIAAPVRWTQVLITLGPCGAYEVGPGRVLQGIAKRTPGAPAVTPTGTIDSLNTKENVR